jgi:hypothetical protein
MLAHPQPLRKVTKCLDLHLGGHLMSQEVMLRVYDSSQIIPPLTRLLIHSHPTQPVAPSAAHCFNPYCCLGPLSTVPVPLPHSAAGLRLAPIPDAS